MIKMHKSSDYYKNFYTHPIEINNASILATFYSCLAFLKKAKRLGENSFFIQHSI